MALEFLVEVPNLGPQTEVTAGGCEHRLELAVVQWFGQEVLGALLHRTDGEFNRAVGRHHDDRPRGLSRGEVREELEACHVWQHDV
jgi:hypothetical protein